VEWCKARACAHRWEEEVRLLFEEQQRTLQFLEWHAIWWMDRTNTIETSDKALAEGRRAYAVRQAELCHQIRRSFAHMCVEGHTMFSWTLLIPTVYLY